MNRKIIPTCLFLLLPVILLAIYWQVAGFDFLRFDDPDYTFANPLVKGGLSPYAICRAFADFRHGAVWMPVTWISYMLDITLFGPGPTGHHLVNLAIHLANTLLLLRLCQILAGGSLIFRFFDFSIFRFGNQQAPESFESLESLKPLESLKALKPLKPLEPLKALKTFESDADNRKIEKSNNRKINQPLFAELLLLSVLFWALHPQRVEAVAWIASRKELLWSFFTLLGLIAWWRDRRWRAFLCCLLACMSKPTAMVFPLLLGLMDSAKWGWDFSIRRFFDFSIPKRGQSPSVGDFSIRRFFDFSILKQSPLRSQESKNRRVENSKSLFSYLPCFCLSLATGLVAVYSQTHPEGMAVKDLFYAGFLERLLNAAVAIGLYLWQMIVPIGLHLDYRAVPGGWPIDGVLGLAVFCMVIVVIFRFFDFSIFRFGNQRGQSPNVGDFSIFRFFDFSILKRGQTPESLESLKSFESDADNRKIEKSTNRRIFLFALLWFLLALTPTLGLFGSFGEHARADRFLYLPAMALPLAVALIFRFFDFSIFRFGPQRGQTPEPLESLKSSKALKPLKFLKPLKSLKPFESDAVNRKIEKSTNRKIYLLFSVIILSFSVQTYRLTASYHNDTTAFERTLACDPNHGRALAHVGEARCAAGKFDEGIDLLRRSREVRPRPETDGKLAYALMTRGRTSDWREIRNICALYDDNSQNFRGLSPESNRKIDESKNRKIDLKGQVLEALGTAELHDREWQAAARHLSQSILAPARFYSADDAKLKLAYAWHNGGRRADAKRIFEAIAKSSRADLAARADRALEIIERSPAAILFW